MRDVIDAVPAADTVKTGVSKPKEVAKGLSEALADTYRLMLKTHAYHWNVEGPLFFQLHKLTEMQYANLFAAADEIAERMRALGQLTPSTFDEIGKLSALKDAEKLPSALNMVEELAKLLNEPAPWDK